MQRPSVALAHRVQTALHHQMFATKPIFTCMVLSVLTSCKVQMLADGSEPGDAIFLEGQAPGATFPKTLKSDFWKKIVAELQVHSSKACCARQTLVTAKGPVHLPSSIPDGAGIH